MVTTRLKSLEDLRDLLFKRINAENADPSAALVREYRETLREIDEVKSGSKKGSLVDELSKRRQRRPGAAGGTAGRRRNAESGS
jgi:hypothetical protein